MNSNKILLTLFMSTLLAIAAFGQGNQGNPLVETIKGTVLNTDSVGNTISIRTNAQKSIVFYVPDKASIMQETRSIGLMDIGKSDSVTIQYVTLSPLKNTIVSMVDNESIVNE